MLSGNEMRSTHTAQFFLFCWFLAGIPLIALHYVLRDQINRRSPLDQQIGMREIHNPFAWFVRDGFLARHQRLYPESSLPIMFKILWGFFYVSLAGFIAAR
jgi:hypothetical protein